MYVKVGVLHSFGAHSVAVKTFAMGCSRTDQVGYARIHITRQNPPNP